MPEQVPGQSIATIQPAQPTESFDIRTMPEAFFPKAPPPAPFPWGLVIGIGALVLLVSGGGLYFIFFWGQPVAPPAPVVRTVQPTPSPATVASPDVSTTTPIVLPGGATPTPTASPGGSSGPFGVLLRTQDRDQDNLTDLEEQSMYTDPDRPDTDGDGYVDGQELENLYDPLAPSPALLQGSRSMFVYENKRFGFRFLYPSVWPAPRSADPNDMQTIVTAPTPDEFFTINVLENPRQQSALEWYLAQAPANTDPRTVSRMFLENLEGVWSADGAQTAYFTLMFGGTREWVYSITYSSGEKRELSYPTIFHTLIQSFRVKPPRPTSPAPSPSPAIP